MSAPAARQPQYAFVADALRKRILSGEFPPGHRLPVEPELSKEYRVSRSTVREALRVLSSQNLVATSRGVAGGSFVVTPDTDQISDYLAASFGLLASSADVSAQALLELRDVLEVPAARLAAQRRTAEHLACLREALIDPQAVEPAAFHEGNRRFHQVLLEASGNPLLAALGRPVFDVLEARLVRSDAPPRTWDRVYAEHREILGFVEAGEVDRAAAAAHAHLDHLRAAYDQMDERRGPRPDPPSPGRGGRRRLDPETSDL
jgi:DNA-binding FadR family transcriptional regulator